MNNWIESLPNPQDPDVIPGVRLFAVMGTWMEADVVAATVRNATAQGCERVYLVDNASPDDTVAVATGEGAILARSFESERYDAAVRQRHMNDLVSEVSALEPDQQIWWLFLDADEFPHGPFGMTLRGYLETLDRRFRVVGTRCFDHYPSDSPHYIPGRHPLDFQPLCEELTAPMCPAMHRKHPLQRYDRDGAPIECGNGSHDARCADQLYEPSQPAFLQHFPFREEQVTRRRLAVLGARDQQGTTRARFRSLDAVYSQNWSAVENSVAVGVRLKPWAEQVEPEHQHVLRWHLSTGTWKYENVDKWRYGDDTTYEKGLAFLDGHGTIEDWGCGFAHAKTFIRESEYIGLDGSSSHASKIVDLRTYTSKVDCIFMRHVLEHNVDWRLILANAVASFTSRMVLVIFTPLGETTRVISTSTSVTSVPVPDISFRKRDLTEFFGELKYSEESLTTDTQYASELIFYIEK